MASLAALLLLLLLLLVPCLFSTTSMILCNATIQPSSSSQVPQAYVVYMGSCKSGGEEAAEMGHLELLVSSLSTSSSSSIQETRNLVIHHYYHAFAGFSAMLTPTQASALSGHEKVVSVFRDPLVKLHTTRSWDFLEVGSTTRVRSMYQHPSNSNDVIIGIIDTGIWPESASFSDEGVGNIPSRWKGTCMEGPDFNKSTSCNRKLIGARYYNSIPQSSNHNHLTRQGGGSASGSPRDSVGHGTHTASTAGGAPVGDASYYGLAKGTARGGSPYSLRIATYKACSEDGCSGSTILKAIDDAVNDGVDIISISIGMDSLFQSNYLDDPIAIGAFHAHQLGVLVVSSAGNQGPDPFTVVNTAPWIFTVAASTIDREFHSTLLLGNGRKFQGSAINFSNLTASETYLLVFAQDVAAQFIPANEARNCFPGSLDLKKVAGKIVICVDTDLAMSRRTKKLVVEDAKAKGMIFISSNMKGNPFDSGVFPFTQVDALVEYKILKYMNSTKYPTATILPTVVVPNTRPAPVVAPFSSRGPSAITENILKPDIMAPGVAILAAIVPKNEVGSVPPGKKPSGYSLKSGTSMACPHVTGAAAIVKSVHTSWSPSMIKSALMTTATVSNNVHRALTNMSGLSASPHEVGAGEVSPYRALHPGLVFETSTQDFLHFLCYSGYPEKDIIAMSNPKFSFNCPKVSFDDLISTINYPSISISKLDRHGPPMTVARTATNVGPSNSTYTVAVYTPVGLAVTVVPEKIVFSVGARKLSYKVSFDAKEAPLGYNFGSLTWSDGRHSVRTVFSVNVL